MRWLAVFGCGHDGRLGLGGSVKDSYQASPVVHPFFNSAPSVGTIVSIHVGGFHTFVRTTKGVYGFGSNDDGQLGTGEKTPSYATPTWISFFGDGDELIDITCGSNHTIAWMRSGLYSCGSNAFGQLGLGDTDSRNVFTKISSPYIDSALDARDDSRASSAPDSRVVVTHVSCGTFHTLVAVKNVFIHSSSNGDALFYPAAVLACGKGDYGELGYDADEWDLLASKERRIKKMVEIQAHHTAMGGAAEDSLVANDSVMGGTGGTMLKKPPAFKKAAKVRRPEFFHAQLKPAKVPVLDDQAARLTQGSDADESSAVVEKVTISEVCAVHLHSAIRLTFTRHNASSNALTASERLFHFGCLYCNEIEGLETSIPTELTNAASTLLLIPDTETAPHLLAGDEMLVASHPRCSNVAVMGKGNLGLGDDDSFCTAFTSISLLPSHAVHKVRGKSHIMLLLNKRDPSDISESPDVPQSILLGFGDNLFGQVGVVSPADDKVCTPVEVIRSGAHIPLFVPPVSKGRGNQKSQEEALLKSVVVCKILDMQCGSRHTVLLLDDGEHSG